MPPVHVTLIRNQQEVPLQEGVPQGPTAASQELNGVCSFEFRIPLDEELKLRDEEGLGLEVGGHGGQTWAGGPPHGGRGPSGGMRSPRGQRPEGMPRPGGQRQSPAQALTVWLKVRLAGPPTGE
jgi:hypothetical protein